MASPSATGHSSATPDTARLIEAVRQLRAQIARRVVGQDAVVEEILMALVAGGHALLVGVPGLAKTLMIRSVADAMQLVFRRIQFTPDLVPSDITGTEILEESASGHRAFRFVQGPVFANIVLADEINRAPPRTQAALLEAMQEHSVTAAGQTMRLPEPFFVLATQNPIEQEGTYPLPEAQVDRFMMKLRVGYPTRAEEKEILRRMAGGDQVSIAPVASPEAILEARRRISELYMDERIVDYIVELVHATRHPEEMGAPDLRPLIEFGASPRATIALGQAARAHAFLRGRAFVTPDDVKSIAPDVLRHRVLTSFEADAEGVTSDTIVSRLLAVVEAP